jgi:hypothetical protein
MALGKRHLRGPDGGRRSAYPSRSASGWNKADLLEGCTLVRDFVSSMSHPEFIQLRRGVLRKRRDYDRRTDLAPR